MKVKIEKKSVMAEGNGIRYGDWVDFLEGLKALKVNHSFLFPRVHSNHRLALSIARVLIGGRFSVRKEGRQYRIGRIA